MSIFHCIAGLGCPQKGADMTPLHVSLIGIVLTTLSVLVIPLTLAAFRMGSRQAIAEERIKQMDCDLNRLRLALELQVQTGNNQQVAIAQMSAQLTGIIQELAKLSAKMDRVIEEHGRHDR